MFRLFKFSSSLGKPITGKSISLNGLGRCANATKRLDFQHLLDDHARLRLFSISSGTDIPSPSRQEKPILVIPGKQADGSQKGAHSSVISALGGNIIIAGAKFWAWNATQSSSMLAEAIHTSVDVGNQALLLIGLQSASRSADSVSPYGYGRNAFFYSLVSAMGMFWLGAGVTTAHGVYAILHNHAIATTWHNWVVLGFSFSIDSYVLMKALRAIRDANPSSSLLSSIRQNKDPMLLAVMCEDLAATSGAVIAASAIALSHWTGSPVWDGVGSILVGGIMASSALHLVRINKQFLVGCPVDAKVVTALTVILASHPAVEKVHSVRSEWVGADAFALRADLDLNGGYFSTLLEPEYSSHFHEHGNAALLSHRADETPSLTHQELLACYAEDVVRLSEHAIGEIKTMVRDKYPEAAFIELQPWSAYSHESRLKYLLRKNKEKIPSS
eukprot:gb/GEZN01006330.1/.p1 GENE.gb/GEZN01006330.1/~~gb/GEZN01006330.1/.p1  ORF type:complete len:444 (-),score=27.91 gb/GEZN01006330.1/:245-1576(-)